MPSSIGSVGTAYSYSGGSVSVSFPSVSNGQCRILAVNVGDKADPRTWSVSDANFGSPILTMDGDGNRFGIYVDNATATRSSGSVTFSVSANAPNPYPEIAAVGDAWDAPVRANQSGGAWAYGQDEATATPITAPSVVSPAASSTWLQYIAAANFGRYHTEPAGVTLRGRQASHESLTSVAVGYKSVGAGATNVSDSWEAELPSGTLNGAGYISASLIVGPAGSTITVTGGGEVDLSGSATPPTITTASPLPSGVVGVAYNATLAASGTGPFTWSLQSGTMNPGLTLNSNGTITGTPTSAVTANVTIKCTGAASPAATKIFTLTTAAPTSAPNAPTNLVGTATTASSIALTWKDNSSDETGFELRRKLTANGTAAETAVKSPNSTSHTFTGLAANTTYYFDVRATGAVNSAYTSEISVATPAATTMYAVVLTEANDGVSDINGSSGWTASVWTTPGVGEAVGTLLGQYNGLTFDVALVSGEARLRINLSTASSQVTNGQALKVYLTDGSRATGVIDATAST